MTAKAALAKALLDGKVVNIKNGFTLFGITNIPREIGRSIEDENRGGFGVIVTRIEREGTSRWKQPCVWVDYKLEHTESNLPGIEKMKEYVQKELGVQVGYIAKPEQKNKKLITPANQQPLNI